jgi:acyl-CoA dehydrogenase|tara:strand:+ start:2215 stop:3327 length:1113 start_codon:yes stop_codon:yes gene_type:complete
VNSLIEFSEEQSMLLDTAMDFCNSRSPLDKVRTLISTEKGFEVEEWNAMVELGWLGITIPEQNGGLGLSMSNVVPIVESMGRQLMSSPFLATTLASHALIHGGTQAQQNEWLPKIATGTVASLALQEEEGDWDLSNLTVVGSSNNDSIVLTGKKTFVLDAAVAELLIVSVSLQGEPALVCVPIDAIPSEQIQRETVIDETRRCYEVNLDGVSVPKSAVMANACFDAIQHASLLLLSAEMAGGLASTLNTIVEYLNTRKQFDRLIGSYQALKHPAADILLGLESVRSHVYHAATIFDSDDKPAIDAALHMAKASASEQFAFAGDRAVQFHGGFGFTYDCNAQLFLRRALWSQYQFGDEKYHRQALAPLLLD